MSGDRHRGLRDRHGRRRAPRDRRRAPRARGRRGSPRSGRARRRPAARPTRRIDGARAARHARRSSTATTTSTSPPRAGSRRRRRCSSGSSRSTRSGGTSTTRPSPPPRAPALAALARSGCGTITDHHYIFPRGDGRPARRRDRGRARDRPALPPLPRRDGPRPQRRRPAARPHRRGPRRDPRRPARRRSTATTTRRPARWCAIALAPTSPFSVTARADGARPRELARARGVRLHTHLAETRDEERLLPRALRGAAAAVPRRPRLAGRRRVAGALRAPRRGRGRAHGRDRHRRRALPDLERRGSARASRRCAACSTPARRSASASTVPRPTSRGELTDELRGALLVGAGARRAAGADRARGARARHPPRRALPRARGRARPPRAWARSPTSRCGASTTPATPASPTPSRRSCSGRRARSHALFVDGEVVVEDGELRTADPAMLAADLARESARLAERAAA